MKTLDVSEAARIIERMDGGLDGPDVVETIDLKGVQAAMLKRGILYIAGTNEFSDWFEFNFDFIHDRAPDAHGFRMAAGDSGAIWHAGFLEHARIVYAFAKPQKPAFIIGHSLGGASAQIVGASLGVPSLSFGSPRTHLGGAHFGREGFVLNICRTDDTLCHLPPRFFGFRHVGSVHWLSPPAGEVEEGHSIASYAELLEAGPLPPGFPEAWPPSA
ncbi:hypothetical protein ACR03S_13445 [Limimaricola variabilis]